MHQITNVSTQRELNKMDLIWRQYFQIHIRNGWQSYFHGALIPRYLCGSASCNCVFPYGITFGFKLWMHKKTFAWWFNIRKSQNIGDATATGSKLGQTTLNTNIERHTAHTIVSWPNPKQWVIVHISDLMMMIRQSIYILSIITRGMGKLKTHSPTYCMIDNWENMLNLTHTLDKIYLTDILYK